MSVVHFNRLENTAPNATPNRQHKVVIAVDGPAASGKSTIARLLASRLGYAHLETGALYRAVAYAALEIGADLTKFSEVEPALAIVKRNLTPELLSNMALRSEDISSAASIVASLPEVRLNLVDYQREFAANPPGNVGGVVLDGRDIGTVICPQADLKFFITADANERAQRRFNEVKARDQSLSFGHVLQDIKQRDQRDSTRKVAPTQAASDAYILDTTYMNANETLDETIAVIRSRFLSETGENRA